MTASERSELQGVTIGEPPTVGLPEWADEVESIGVLSDEREGTFYAPNYATLEAAFDYPEPVKEEPYTSVVRDYFELPDAHPMALRRLAARDDERASQVVRLLYSRPKFVWERDAEDFLRPYKSRFEDADPNPGVIPISGKLSQAVQKEAKAKTAVPPPPMGRNAPCPCGSGQKYKKCCGK